jgi:N utilization substance protein B
MAGDTYAQAWELRREQEDELTSDPLGLITDLVGLLESSAPKIDDELRAAIAQRWDVARLAATDRAVLRVAGAELLARPGSPARVVLDEAIEIARTFGSEESGRFVNGALDRAARHPRPAGLMLHAV